MTTNQSGKNTSSRFVLILKHISYYMLLTILALLMMIPLEWPFERLIQKQLKNVEHFKFFIAARKLRKSIVYHGGLVILSTIWLVPVVWLIVSSFQTGSGPNILTFFPKELTFDNYINLFFHSDDVAKFPTWFLNTFIVAIFTCLISTMFVLMVSYPMSRMRFSWRKPLMNIGVILGLFPGVLAMIAVYFILKAAGLTGTLTALILVYSASSGLGYLVAKGFFDTIPKSLDEAAKIDGASQWDIFWKIIMPLSKPIIVYTVLLSFLAPWVDFFFARIIIPPTEYRNMTVAVGLFNMLERNLVNSYFAIFTAGAVIVSIPIAGLFILMQKFYVEGVTGGSVKG